MTIAILFHRIGPYHHARLTAINKSVEIVAIEFSKVDLTYAWEDLVVEKDYLIQTLFQDADVDSVSANIVSERVKNTLSTLQPRIVAIPGWSSPGALAALAWCVSVGVPAILMSDSAAQDIPRSWWGEWIKSRVVRMFSAAIVAGTRHVQYACELGMVRKNIFVGYDVVDNNYFLNESIKIRADEHTLRRQHNLPDQYFLASNRFVKKKNLSRLLDAYANYVLHVGSAAWDLVLLGDGELKASIIKQVEFLGIANRVHFLGFKQYNELPLYYGLANVFIHASTTEQWGLVVNEAMASGLPVLVSDRCGCAPDLVNKGVNGFTFDPYNAQEIAELLIQISNGSYNLALMGKASREIINRWSLITFVSGIKNAFLAALSAPLPSVGWCDRALLWVLIYRSKLKYFK